MYMYIHMAIEPDHQSLVICKTINMGMSVYVYVYVYVCVYVYVYVHVYQAVDGRPLFLVARELVPASGSSFWFQLLVPASGSSSYMCTYMYMHMPIEPNHQGLVICKIINMGRYVRIRIRICICIYIWQ